MSFTSVYCFSASSRAETEVVARGHSARPSTSCANKEVKRPADDSGEPSIRTKRFKGGDNIVNDSSNSGSAEGSPACKYKQQRTSVRGVVDIDGDEGDKLRLPECKEKKNVVSADVTLSTRQANMETFREKLLSANENRASRDVIVLDSESD